MDWLTFIKGIVDALVWPATILAVLFFLKDQLVELVPMLTRLKVKDVELEFSKGVHAVALAAQEELSKSPIAIADEVELTMTSRLYDVSKASPRTAILEAWLEVEHSAQRALISRGMNRRPLRLLGPTSLRKLLESSEILNDELIAIYEQLRRLRNQAVHFAYINISEAEVLDYINSALALAQAFNQVADSTK
jgi:hypothetical protein